MDEASVAALANPITKLIEVASAGLGRVYEPTHIKRLAKAEAEAARIRAEGDVAAALIKAQGDVELDGLARRVVERLAAREVRRQENVEAILLTAADVLREHETVSDEPVEEGWSREFFRLAEDVSDEQLRTLWGRLLAGEVRRPGAFSIRALRMVRTLNPREAQMFAEACCYVWTISGMAVIPAVSRENRAVTLRQADEIYLGEIGLIDPQPLSREVTADPISARYGDTRYALTNDPTKRDLFGPPVVWFNRLTAVGSQLFPLSGASPSVPFRDAVLTRWRSDDIVVTAV